MDEILQQLKEFKYLYMNREEPDKENLIKNVMQQTIKDGMIPKIISASKNQEIATKKINEANKVISSASLEKLIEIYNEAVAHAPPNSNLLARAYANRSAVLTNGALYEDSLKDIERAMKIGYPDNLKAKLYTRKAKNLLASNNKVEVEEAVAQANLWIEKMDESNKKKVLSTLKQLEEDKSVKNTIEKWDFNIFLRKTPDDNPKLLGASGSIDLQMSKKFGRHIVATKDIKAGDTILVSRFYLCLLKTEHRYRNCWYCCKTIYSGIPCNTCSNVMYCNQNCRDNAWKDYHDIECLTIGSFINSPSLCMNEAIGGSRILIKALKEFGTIDALSKKIDEINSIDDPILKCFTKNVFDGTKYASVHSLFCVESKLDFNSAVAYTIVKMLFILSATSQIFGKKYNDPTDLVNNKWAVFVGNLLFKHMEIIGTNALNIPAFNRRGEPVEACGTFLAPLVDLFNHSCDYDAYPININNDEEALIASRPIKKGEQICITYGAMFDRSSVKERRLYLQEYYNFRCECIACANNWGPTTQHSSCLGKLSKKDYKNIMKAFENLNRDLTTMNSSLRTRTWNISCDKIIKMITDMLALLNTLGPNRYPCQELINAKYNLLSVYTYVTIYNFVK